MTRWSEASGSYLAYFACIAIMVVCHFRLILISETQRKLALILIRLDWKFKNLSYEFLWAGMDTNGHTFLAQ